MPVKYKIKEEKNLKSINIHTAYAHNSQKPKTKKKKKREGDDEKLKTTTHTYTPNEFYDLNAVRGMFKKRNC